MNSLKTFVASAVSAFVAVFVTVNYIPVSGISRFWVIILIGTILTFAGLKILKK